jgi:hypothetical protein
LTFLNSLDNFLSRECFLRKGLILRIDHAESYKDFGKQFLVDSKIDGYFGSQELLEDIVKPFDLKKIIV